MEKEGRVNRGRVFAKIEELFYETLGIISKSLGFNRQLVFSEEGLSSAY